jgi:hypothetical protein
MGTSMNPEGLSVPQPDIGPKIAISLFNREENAFPLAHL